MKTKITLITGLIAIWMASFTGCGGNNSSNSLGGCFEGGWSQEVSEELNNLIDAQTTYNNDPTLETCQIYEDATIDYFEALSGLDAACIPETVEQNYQEALADAEQEIDEFNCTESHGQ